MKTTIADILTKPLDAPTPTTLVSKIGFAVSTTLVLPPLSSKDIITTEEESELEKVSNDQESAHL